MFGLKYPIRVLAKNFGFTAFALFSLALGVGANAAVFSVVRHVLLQPIGYKDQSRLVSIWTTEPQVRFAPASRSDFSEWIRQSDVFEGMTAWRYTNHTLAASEDRSEFAWGCVVTANFFDVLGVQPALGRAFAASDASPRAAKVAVIGNALWKRKFGADPNVAGRAIQLDREAYVIVGVAPPDFPFPGKLTDAWTPLVLENEKESRTNHYLRVFARMRQGVSLRQAQSQMDTIAKRLESAHPESNAGVGFKVELIEEQLHGEIKPILLSLSAILGVVLLIACTNLAFLLLTRANRRRREVAVRFALGASRAAILRQLITESLILSFAGGAAGLLLAQWGSKLLVSLIPGRIASYVPGLDSARLDMAVFLFTFGVAAATGVLFGIGPAWESSRVSDLAGALRESAANISDSRRRRRLSGILIGAEIAIALVLLIAAGLMIRSYERLLSERLGFDPGQTIAMLITLPRGKYPDDGKVEQFFEEFLSRVRNATGVQSAGLIDNLPLGGSNADTTLTVEGRQPVPPGQEILTEISSASPAYFRAMRIALSAGRYFTEQDTGAAPKVAIISESLARRFWPQEDALGKRIKLGKSDEAWREVVGVVADVRWHEFDNYPVTRLYTYVPFAQRPRSTVNVVARTGGNVRDTAAAMRKQLAAVDRSQPVIRFTTMDRLVASAMAQRRFNMGIASAFAALAIVLACAGIYGLISYSVGERAREIGIRMALGSRRSDTVLMIVRECLSLTLAAIVAGLFSAWALGRVIAEFLYGIKPTDPAVFVLATLFMTLAAAAASVGPAFRAARADLSAALRQD